MSTRCKIIISNGDDELWFYRHGDGYPDDIIPDLKKFMSWVKKIAKDLSLSDLDYLSGWLVIWGNKAWIDRGYTRI